MTHFRFRAECFNDALRMLVCLADIDAIEIDKVEIAHVGYAGRLEPDCVVSLHTSLSLDAMKSAAASVVDGHTMQQTMQTAKRYTGERVE